MPTIEVNGTQIYYEDYGPKDAPAIVFSHSLFFTSRMFFNQIKHFAGEFRVICYDQRGQGQSARDSLENLDMDTLTEDAAALIEALELGRCHFAGNSMGGFIALRLAARRPDLLISCTVLGSSAEEEYKKAEFQPVVEQLQQYGGKPILDTMMYIMFGDTSLTDPNFAEERTFWQEHMAGLDQTIGDAAYQVVHRKSVLEELNGVEIPVMAIAGAEDHAYTIQQSENIAKTVKNGVCEVVNGAGHSVALEKPSEVNRLLAEHLTKAANIHS
ncbi:alpha/beta fold hydrolase [Mesobacillus harenae]|uniref:alpha/beta fold hydrolase n=1 Tax=Mesobacillus harenae TaxID=2213203 RepID=UPI0015808DC7|nr:alpha/beta hydrolase [Mesobacillus harenae]